MAQRAHYKGDGTEYHAGIPAQNIEEEEWQALSNEQRELLRDSPLYDVKTNAEMAGTTATAPAPATGPKKDDGERGGS